MYLSSKPAIPTNLAQCLVPHTLTVLLFIGFWILPFFFSLSPLSCRFYLLLEFGLTVGLEVIIQKSHGEQLRVELVFGQLEMFLWAIFLK